MPDLPPETAGEELPALVASLRAANARLREVIETKNAQLAAASAALEAAEARITGLAERVADLERRLGKDSLHLIEAAVLGQPVYEKAQGPVPAQPLWPPPGQAAGRPVRHAAAGA